MGALVGASESELKGERKLVSKVTNGALVDASESELKGERQLVSKVTNGCISRC